MGEFVKGLLVVLLIPLGLVLFPMLVDALEKTKLGRTAVTIAAAVGLILFILFATVGVLVLR